MKHLDHNAVQRSLNLMGFALADRTLKKRHDADAYRLAEVQLQHQIKVEGEAGVGVFEDFDLIFKEILYYAPRQRMNTNKEPQMWWGATLDKGQAFFSVHVKKWNLTEGGNYKGATVSVGVQQGSYPGAGGTELTHFEGRIHVTFQGFGIPVTATGAA